MPSRENEIVAMLTNQKSEEVALLRLTRELVDKVEKEQPERKLSIVEQSNYAMVIEPTSEQEQNKLKKKCRHTTRMKETQKVVQNQTSMEQSEEKSQYELKTQETNKENQEKKAVKVSIGNSNEMEVEQTQQKQEETEEYEKRNTSTNEEEPEDAIMIEEPKNQKRAKQRIEKEINIIGALLEESIWAPNKRNCSRDNSLLANIPAHNVPGETSEERIKFIKWSLKDNEHVKDIKEVFKRGNL